MSWLPGVGPVKDINQLGISRGLSEDWYSNVAPHKRNRKEIKKGNFWDIIDNPLYEVAAAAKGYDWAAWVAEAKGKVGSGTNDGIVRVRAMVRPASAGSAQSGGPNAGIQYTQGSAAQYEWMTRDEAEERGLSYEVAKTTRWRNKETGEIMIGRANRGSGSSWSAAQQMIGGNLPEFQGAVPGVGAVGWSNFRGRRGKAWEDEWEELRDWGVGDEGITEDLDEINGWLMDIVNVNKHLPKIIREGPKGKHYGIEGDIWEHYGLDKEPEPPKEMEWDSYDKKMQLSRAVASTAGYNTPEGLTKVDLHGD